MQGILGLKNPKQHLFWMAQIYNELPTVKEAIDLIIKSFIIPKYVCINEILWLVMGTCTKIRFWYC